MDEREQVLTGGREVNLICRSHKGRALLFAVLGQKVRHRGQGLTQFNGQIVEFRLLIVP